MFATCGYSDHTVHIHNSETGEWVSQITLQSRNICRMAIHPQLPLIAISGDSPHIVTIFDMHALQVLHTLTSFTQPVHSVSFAPDGSVLACGDASGTVTCFNTSEYSLLWKQTKHGAGNIVGMSYSPCGQFLITGSNDCTCIIWQNEEVRNRLSGVHMDGVKACLFLHDCETVVSGSSDNKIGIWNGFTGELKALLVDHTAWVYCIVLHPEKDLFLSASFDGSLRLWSGEDFRCIKTIRHVSSGVAAFSSTDTVIVCSNQGQVVEGCISRENEASLDVIRTFRQHGPGMMFGLACRYKAKLPDYRFLEPEPL